MLCVVVLPSFEFSVFDFSVFDFSIQHVGEIHRVDFNYYSRSPLSEPDFTLVL